MLHSSRRALRLAALAGCTALVLSGCGGGSVSVRSNFSGAPVAPPGVSGAPLPPGLTAHYSGRGNVGLAILGIVIVADLMQWTTTMLKQALGGEALQDAKPAHLQQIISMPKKCVYPVPEMCRPTLVPERQVHADAAAARSVEHVTSSVDVLHSHSVGFE